jgi:hypothetical protein
MFAVGLGNHDKPGIRAQRLDFFYQFYPVLDRQQQVYQGDIRLIIADYLFGLGPVLALGDNHAEVMLFDDASEHRTDTGIIIDDYKSNHVNPLFRPNISFASGLNGEKIRQTFKNTLLTLPQTLQRQLEKGP